MQYILEYDGLQHVEYTPIFHKTLEGFEDRKNRDVEKTRYALRNGYRLIRISYIEKSIDDITHSINDAISSGRKIWYSDPEMYGFIREKMEISGNNGLILIIS